MKITSRDRGNGKILTWADINIQDGKPDPNLIRRITLNVEAGDIVTLEVESYDMDNPNRVSADDFSTTIKEYCVDKIEIEVKSYEELQRENIQSEQITKETQTMNELKKKRLANLNPITELKL